MESKSLFLIKVNTLVRIGSYSCPTVGGGSIALYVRSSFKVKILEKSNTTGAGECKEPEYLMCPVQQGDSSPVFVAVSYRPPHDGL